MTEIKSVTRYLREYHKQEDGLIEEYKVILSEKDLNYFKDVFNSEEDIDLLLCYPILYKEERDYLLSNCILPFDIFNTEQCDYFLEADAE